jgi:NitT/TauT family transport system substrate-binding protein
MRDIKMLHDAFRAKTQAGVVPRAEVARDSSCLCWSRMKSRNALIASLAAIITLATGCSSGSGGSEPKLALEKTSIVVGAFPSIDSAGLYIAEMDGLFAAQGLNVKIVSAGNPPPTTQDLINGQIEEKYDVTAGDYVTYIENEVLGTAYLRIIAEASFLQPNVQTLLINGTSSVNSVGQLRDSTVSVNAPDDIGTLLLDSLLTENGIRPSQVRLNNYVPFSAVAHLLTTKAVSASYATEPFVSMDEENVGAEELADLDQGSAVDFPIEGYVVTEEWAQKNPNTLKAFVRALSQGQEIADTNRSAVEKAAERYLNISPATAAFISLPTFPTAVDPVRLQRVIDAMVRFGLLPPGDSWFRITTMLSS